MSTATTGGFGNPVLATIEAAAASVLSVISVIWPIVAFVLAVLVAGLCWLIIYFVGKRLLRLFRRKAPATVASTAG
jgi:uncharacterized membrane protein YoaK (UPF0700 family)